MQEMVEERYNMRARNDLVVLSKGNEGLEFAPQFSSPRVIEGHYILVPYVHAFIDPVACISYPRACGILLHPSGCN